MWGLFSFDTHLFLAWVKEAYTLHGNSNGNRSIGTHVQHLNNRWCQFCLCPIADQIK